MTGYQRKQIDRCAEKLEKLSSWECEFIESLRDRSDSYELSDKQNSVLNRIAQNVAFAGR